MKQIYVATIQKHQFLFIFNSEECYFFLSEKELNEFIDGYVTDKDKYEINEFTKEEFIYSYYYTTTDYNFTLKDNHTIFKFLNS